MRAGARVITSPREADLDRCRSLGAAVALNHRDPNLARCISDAAPDAIDVHLDTSRRQCLADAVHLLAPRRRIIVIAARSERSQELPIRRLYNRDRRLIGFAISRLGRGAGRRPRRITQLLADGWLAPSAVETLPLSDPADAHRRLEAGEARGRRLILCPPA